MVIPTTYAGGAKCNLRRFSKLKNLIFLFAAIEDLGLVDRLSNGKVDLTYGRYVPIDL